MEIAAFDQSLPAPLENHAQSTPAPGPRVAPAGYTALATFCWSAPRGVYHRETCGWAVRIRKRNLCGGTRAEANRFGRRACRVCKPDRDDAGAAS